MWRFLQLLILFFVGLSNIQYHWTPNGYLAAMIAFGIAYLVTEALSKIIDLLRYRQALLRQQRRDERSLRTATSATRHKLIPQHRTARPR